MKNLKYRAWDPYKKVMLSWEELQTTAPYGWKTRGLEPLLFTQLLDKNGKEIYEGDIIWAGKFDRHNGQKIVCSVAWDETNRLRSAHKWYMGGYTLKLARPLLDSISDFDQEAKWEIIGNIYENPDLIT